MSGAYYNEIDEAAIAWLRELLKRGLIPDGEIDTRSIVDVRSDDLRGFRQYHFFAGIGGWAYALRLAGWPDARAVWTGSCPCQPFSAAGKGAHFTDSRHLWPAWFPLIQECRPATVFGEQVASADGRYWLDAVLTDLENIDYAIGAFDLPACGVGAPHKRQRLWFVADDDHDGQPLRSASRLHDHGEFGDDAVRRGADGGVADAAECGREAGSVPRPGEPPTGREAGPSVSRHGSAGGGVGDSGGARLEGLAGDGDDGHEPGWFGTLAPRPVTAAGPLNGFWADADWLPCIDGKARPVEPGSFPLAHGIPARVGRLRGYGNAIVPQVAAEVIRAYMDVKGETR